MEQYISFRVCGLEHCILSEQNIDGISQEFFKKVCLSQDNETKVCNITFWIDKFMSKEEFDEKIDEIIFGAKGIIKQIIGMLLVEGFDILDYRISEPSIGNMEPGHAKVKSSITLYTIDTGIETKEYQKQGIVLQESQVNNEQQEIVDILSVPDKITRYEFLFEKLKKKCGGKQEKVIEKIKNEYKDISIKNHNIDKGFWGGRQEWQDDFSYLRTLISHGKAEHFQEINERIDRETNKIIKVLFDLSKKNRPQDKLGKKAGLIWKKYKVNRKVAEKFQKACEEAGVTMETQLTKMMKEFIKEMNNE